MRLLVWFISPPLSHLSSAGALERDDVAARTMKIKNKYLKQNDGVDLWVCHLFVCRRLFRTCKPSVKQSSAYCLTRLVFCSVKPFLYVKCLPLLYRLLAQGHNDKRLLARYLYPYTDRMLMRDCLFECLGSLSCSAASSLCTTPAPTATTKSRSCCLRWESHTHTLMAGSVLKYIYMRERDSSPSVNCEAPSNKVWLIWADDIHFTIHLRSYPAAFLTTHIINKYRETSSIGSCTDQCPRRTMKWYVPDHEQFLPFFKILNKKRKRIGVFKALKLLILKILVRVKTVLCVFLYFELTSLKPFFSFLPPASRTLKLRISKTSGVRIQMFLTVHDFRFSNSVVKYLEACILISESFPCSDSGCRSIRAARG